MFTPVWAESIQLQVDKNYVNNNSDGSLEKPYTEIGKAIEACTQECVLNVKNGIYNENIILKEGVKIIGEDNQKTIITSLRSAIITAKGKNEIENITVLGGYNGIIFENGGSLKNSFIRNASRIGITLKENSSLVEISNSTLKNNGKGIYAEKGSEFNIAGNVIGKPSETNTEEGVDIREKTKGKISRNLIANNGEGGVEIIVGGSDLLIEQNVIQDNQASGIAFQFYRIAQENGKISIQKNVIQNNKKSGFVCKNPSGGIPPYEYFNKSIALSGNIIKNNNLADIDLLCHMKQNADQKEIAMSAKEIEEIEKMAEKNGGEEQPYDGAIFKSLVTEKKISYTKIDNNFKKLAKESKMKVFFLGPSGKNIKIIKNEIQKLSTLKIQLAEAANKFEKIGSLLDEKMVEEEIKDIEYISGIQGTAVSEKENMLSLYGWFYKLWNK